MTFADIKKAASELDPTEQLRLVGYLLSLQRRDDPAYREELARRIDQTDPARWISLDDLERRIESRARKSP